MINLIFHLNFDEKCCTMLSVIAQTQTDNFDNRREVLKNDRKVQYCGLCPYFSR